MRITVVKDSPLASEARHLPAEQYNLARLLQARAPGGIAFVPVRRMQILAIIDAGEFVFVESVAPQSALIVWSDFSPRSRASLQDPVPFEAHYHRPDATEIQRRLQPELHAAMRLVAARQLDGGTATILPLPDPVAP